MLPPDPCVLITGAASGIGLATALRLQRANAHVFATDLREESVTGALDALRAAGGTQPTGCACDVRSAEDCERLVSTMTDQLGLIDALVHCAGILRAPGSRPRFLHDLDDEEYDAVIGTNLTGTLLVNRAVLQAMIPQRAGQIVNISSTSGRRGRPLDSVYSASKAGVIALSESIAEEVRSLGIRVQVVLPDAVDTPLWQQNVTGAKAPPKSLPADRVAEVIEICLSLPPNATVENLVVMPCQSRRS